MRLSVIICTHNPRQDYLRRTLGALEAQTLLKEQWEMLFIDNASKVPLASQWDLSWHPHARHIREDELGLTPARLRGIRESKGELLVFVDDDNVLDADYLQVALKIASDRPYLGVFGGSIRAEFETEPASWTKPFWCYLAIQEVEQDMWSNLIEPTLTHPFGAGMCVGRSLASAYVLIIQNDKVRFNFDRKGASLISGGDSDLVMTACRSGSGIGLFKDLKLTHLMPSARLEEPYLLRLVEAMSYTSVLLYAKHDKLPQIPKNFPFRRQLGIVRRFFTMKPRQRRFYEAKLRGYLKGVQEVSSWKSGDRSQVG
jgi:glycosyltransferase involved in cell wall biosynthesis